MKWDEVVNVALSQGVQSPDKELLSIVCFDEDLIMDTNVGEVQVMASEIIDKKQWIDLFF